MLTKERIAELRRLEAGYYQEFRDETVPYPISHEEMAELLDAAEAWELYARDQIAWSIRLRGFGDDLRTQKVRWSYNRQDSRLLWTGWSDDPPTPQAAVLAALRPKGEPDGLGDAMP